MPLQHTRGSQDQTMKPGKMRKHTSMEK